MKWFFAIWLGIVFGWLALEGESCFSNLKKREQFRARFRPLADLPSPLWRMNRLWISVLAELYPADFWPALLDFYRQRLLYAGFEKKIVPQEWLAFKIVLALEAVLLGLVSPLFLWGALPAFFWPDLWLWQIQKERRQKIERELPLVMDLLALSVEAGLDFVPALKRIADFLCTTLLGEELKKVIEEMQLGFSRLEALQNFGRRLPLKAVRNLVAHLSQTVKLGAPLGPVLSAQADRLRALRFQAAEKAGIYAAQKMLFPLVLCIVPSVFIIIFGPLMARWYYGGFHDLF